jgi:hypothetical protein
VSTKPNKPVKYRSLIVLFLSPVLANAGCQHIGPRTIAEDRIAYNEAIASSWKEQILLNIVRLRYSDMADFVDVGTLSQNYTLTGTTQASFGASIYPWDKMMNTLMPSVMGTRTKSDNPTVTYTPQSGSDFTKNLIAPIKPDELFNLFEENYRNVMNLGVMAINDIRNEPANTRARGLFRKVARAMSEAYCKGDIRFPVDIQPDSKEKTVFMIIEERDSSNEPCPEDLRYDPLFAPPDDPVAVIREALRLKPGVTKFKIVVGWRPTKEDEIAVRTHSAISAMIWLSQYVQVPESSFAKYPGLKSRVPRDPEPLLTVHNGPTKPAGDKYAVIKYQDNWFWIDWGDPRSTRAMIYLRTLLALADTGARPTTPVLTLPISR